MRWRTDINQQRPGFNISNVRAICADGGGCAAMTGILLNKGVDGVLLHQDDDAYFSFQLPANRTAYVVMDHNFEVATKDFDIFLKQASSACMVQASCSGSTYCGFSGASQGEFIKIPATSAARQFQGRVNAYAGAGRYRLTVVSPVATYSSDVDIAYDASIAAGSPLDLRAKLEWNEGRRWLLAASDGQYGVKDTALVTDDVSCFSCYDLVFSEANEPAGVCVPGVQTVGLFGDYIELAGPFWKGTSWIASDNTNCGTFPPARVGETIAHEWGHLEFDLCDERGGQFWCNPSGTGVRCGFSIMAGGTFADFGAVGFKHWEFCAANHHGKDVACNPTCQDPAFGDSNWTDMIDVYSTLVSPEAGGSALTPDFSQFTHLGPQAITTFTGPF